MHHDQAAGEAARNLGARAFTTGQDIYFAPGAYSPSTPQGKGLLAHELTHTIQQRSSRPGVQHVLEVSPPDDPLEHQADQVSHAVMRGEQPGRISSVSHSSINRSTSAFIQRQPATAPAPAAPTGPDASGYFVVGLGGLKIKQEEIDKSRSRGVFKKDVSSMSLPGLKLKTLTLDLFTG